MKELGDRRGESHVLKNIGQIYYSKGDHDKALELSGEALMLSKSLMDKPGESQILRNIGRIYSSKGDEDKALEVFENALVITRDLGNKFGECQVLKKIGNIYNLKGEFKKAEKLNKEALKIKKELGNRYESFRQLESIGEIDYSKSDHLINGKKEAKIEAENIEPETDEKNIILLVESNKDVRKFIRNGLEKLYRVEVAVDGQKGIGKAKEIIPDLIISNIMIPGVNGYDLCRILKKDINTSHIPIILLIAESSDEVIIKALEAGADDTITKLINIKILCARIKNSIEQRRQLQLKMQRQRTLMPDEIAVSSIDETFLNELQSIVEKSLSDPDFNLNQLSRELYMGRTALFRKIVALTGQTPNQYIQSYRLQRAAQLLKSNFGGITQVAFKVGFSSSAYFTKCFKEKFHQLPSTYLEAESKSKSLWENIQTEKNENGDEV